jgi:hypothetical protein
MRDDRVDAGLNATLDIGSVMFKISFAIFVPVPTTPGIKVSWMWRTRHHSNSSHSWPLCLRLHK